MDDKKPLDPQHPSGPVKLGDLKVWVDRNLCIGAATCIALAPNTFLLDSEAKAIIINTSERDTQEAIIEAAKACPVAAVFIEDASGKRIFPE